MTVGRSARLGFCRIGFGKAQHGFDPIKKQFAVGQASQIVVHGVVQQAFFGGLERGHIGERADEPHHLAIGTDHRTRSQRKPQVMPIGRAHAEILRHAATPLFEHAVERGAEAVAVEMMQDLEPFRRRSLQRSALEPQHGLGLAAGEDMIGRDVPVPDHVAGARQRQCSPFDVGDNAVGDAARKGMLHHGEPDQHDDQHQAAEQRRRDNVVGQVAEHSECRTEHPDDQQQPGRDQKDGAVEVVRREVDDKDEAEHGNQKQRDAGDA